MAFCPTLLHFSHRNYLKRNINSMDMRSYDKVTDNVTHETDIITAALDVKTNVKTAVKTSTLVKE